jgi:ABC-type sugar transport system ATPase subunit
MLLKVSRIRKEGDGHFVLKNISFTQKKQQKIAIVGETGSGKSTLLKIISGLVQQEEGEVWLGKEKVKGPSEKLVPGHPAIAYLSQYFELQKFLTVEQILTYANLLSQKEANALYEICQIDHLLQRKTDQLSGGEKQRIAMARLLISSPKLLLLDEPFSHLDMVHKSTLKSVIHNISQKLNITCILVSHDPSDTLSWADKILVMKEGEIVQEGTPQKIYRQPVSEYVAGLFGKYTLMTPELVKVFLPGAKIKRAFLRPEDFSMTKKGEKTTKGKVKRVNFLGGYCEVDVSLLETIITVRTGQKNIKAGDKVYIVIN